MGIGSHPFHEEMLALLTFKITQVKYFAAVLSTGQEA